MKENFPNLVKEIDVQVQAGSTESPKQERCKQAKQRRTETESWIQRAF